MNSDSPATIFLKDYQPPAFWIKSTDLRFELFDQYTLVHATCHYQRNADHPQPLELVGENLELVCLDIDGKTCTESDYSLTPQGLSLASVDASFKLSITTKIDPKNNTSLEGLYHSGSMYCTQCEAEGFRKITYYLDRPDVLSTFSVRLEADKTQFPILLSNGNCTDTGELEGGRHFASWLDPFPKPSYLFALVAGDLECVSDTFTTVSGRTVDIKVFVEKKDTGKCEHAILALKNAMTWDQKVYGREYDLDVYMIVAVDDFNMGAMENKGLNIFNTACVLASEATTTDEGFQRVEGVIAHEYFHNWSGNRVTCRDWFQLSLKEGFTVFRDQEFSADMGSRTVKRVEDVQSLRALQFAEDAGPMAHPVRPASFIEISNFYTLTVYEKGAEVVRMIRTLLGESLFREGSDLYFQQHDGSAATIEDFIAAMASVSGEDFGQFMNWYSQAGTPLVSVDGHYDAEAQTFTLGFRQECAGTPEASAEAKSPFLIPISMGLLGQAGSLPLRLQGETEVGSPPSERVLRLSQASHSFTFEGVGECPVPALLRGFSAPVNLRYNYSPDNLLRLMLMETDGYCRWDAAQQLAVDTIKSEMKGATASASSPLLKGLEAVLQDQTLEPAMVALMLTLPAESYLGLQFEVVDVDLIHHSLKRVKRVVSASLEPLLWNTYLRCQSELTLLSGVGEKVIGLRALKNTALSYLAELDQPIYLQACDKQYREGTCMSDVYTALKALVHSSHASFKDSQTKALSHFYEKWQHESLVVNQWFSVQASAPSHNTLKRVKGLLQHSAFGYGNPNKVRSLIGAFCHQNPVGFHQASGEGYAFLGDQILKLNDVNPQIAARLVTPLSKWRRYDTNRQAMMKAQLARIAAHKGLSTDVYEIVSKSLKE